MPIYCFIFVVLIWSKIETMIYPENFEEKIGFDKIRELLREKCHSPMGKEQVDQMQMTTDVKTINREVRLTAEIVRLRAEDGESVMRIEVADMRERLRRLRTIGMVIETEEAAELRKTLETLSETTAYIRGKEEEECPILKEETANVENHDDVIRRINRVLDKFGQIRDDASPKLLEIRRDMVRVKSSVGRLIQSIMQQARSEGYVDGDSQVAVREGRLVLPVNTASKRKVRGIVHDASATGKTVYIEPEAVVESNNKLRELEADEKREIREILTLLTDDLRPSFPLIAESYEYLGRIDFKNAEASLAEEIDAKAIEVDNVRRIDMGGARHPILELSLRAEGKQINPLDIRLKDGQRILMISGPNAGGKSVCLKTVGLLQYMVQCGMMIPVRSDSRAGIFESIFIDIGDEQSIENDLSTYSSHLLNMKTILKNGNERSLVLIDEAGGGTEPQIGGAIAESLMEQFTEMKVSGIVTTHYTNLKNYAEATEGVVNGAMLYDRQGMRPLFQLQIGNPGSSFAVEIARNIGLPEKVIESAIEKVGTEYVNSDKYLQDVVRDKRYWEQKRQQIRMRNKKIAEVEEKYIDRLENINAERKDILRRAKEEAKRIVVDANAKVEGTIKAIRESAGDKEKIKTARQQLEKAKAELSEERNDNFDNRLNNLKKERKEKKQEVDTPRTQSKKEALKTGDNVRLDGQLTIGKIVSINGNRAEVSFGHLRTAVDTKKLERVSQNEAKRALRGGVRLLNTAPVETMKRRRQEFQMQLDIRGLRADEALIQLTNYIDDAIMIAVPTVRILHGTGTGALREVVRQYLGSAIGVKAFHDEHVQLGGSGITVVEFE